jgi:methylenetetrahydrofolate dehydrogenase (NADP+)/methenyltetrahydrofolate cyclohydrolase
VQIFDGKEYAKFLEKMVVDRLLEVSIEGSLTIVQIGENPSSEKYIQIKKRLCEKLGIPIEIHNIDSKLSDMEINKRVGDILSSDKVLGGIIQLPLPRKELSSVLRLIPLEKDIDVISEEGTKRFYSGDFYKLSPIVRAVKFFIEENNISANGLKVCVIGEGDLVGRPIAHFMRKLGAQVSVLSNCDGECKISCQLLVLTAGIPKLIKGENIDQGCSVIDFGSEVVDGKCVGDLDLDSKIDHLNLVSPSPGGVGPLVIRFLLMNLLGI